MPPWSHQHWQPINTILFDSQRLFREALHRSLEVPPLRMIGQGCTLAEALTDIPSGTELHLAIYNFASDAEVERELQTVEALRNVHANIKSVILTDCHQPALLLKAASIGVEAFLSRNMSVDVLQRALELVMLGQYVLPTELVQMLLDPARAVSANATAAVATPPTMTSIQISPFARDLAESRRSNALTPRECEILQCLTDGRSNKEIARHLNLTEATVKAHVKALLRKTQMTNRTQAAIWAMTRNVPANDLTALGETHDEVGQGISGSGD